MLTHSIFSLPFFCFVFRALNHLLLINEIESNHLFLTLFFVEYLKKSDKLGWKNNKMGLHDISPPTEEYDYLFRGILSIFYFNKLNL